MVVVLVVNDNGKATNLPIPFTNGWWQFATNQYATLQALIEDLHTLELDSATDGAPFVLSGSCEGAIVWDEAAFMQL